MKPLLTLHRTSVPTDDAERGDVPGWVLVTIVTEPKVFGSRVLWR